MYIGLQRRIRERKRQERLSKKYGKEYVSNLSEKEKVNLYRYGTLDKEKIKEKQKHYSSVGKGIEDKRSKSYANTYEKRTGIKTQYIENKQRVIPSVGVVSPSAKFQEKMKQAQVELDKKEIIQEQPPRKEFGGYMITENKEKPKWYDVPARLREASLRAEYKAEGQNVLQSTKAFGIGIVTGATYPIFHPISYVTSILSTGKELITDPFGFGSKIKTEIQERPATFTGEMVGQFLFIKGVSKGIKKLTEPKVRLRSYKQGVTYQTRYNNGKVLTETKPKMVYEIKKPFSKAKVVVVEGEGYAVSQPQGTNSYSQVGRYVLKVQGKETPYYVKTSGVVGKEAGVLRYDIIYNQKPYVSGLSGYKAQSSNVLPFEQTFRVATETKVRPSWVTKEMDLGIVYKLGEIKEAGSLTKEVWNYKYIGTGSKSAIAKLEQTPIKNQMKSASYWGGLPRPQAEAGLLSNVKSLPPISQQVLVSTSKAVVESIAGKGTELKMIPIPISREKVIMDIPRNQIIQPITEQEKERIPSINYSYEDILEEEQRRKNKTGFTPKTTSSQNIGIGQIPTSAQKQAQQEDITQKKQIDFLQKSATISQNISFFNVPVGSFFTPKLPESRNNFSTFGSSLYVRRQGIFKKVGSFGSVKEAFVKGKSIVEQTAGASFKVESQQDFNPFIGGLLSRSSFYESKREPNVFIQKKEKRISTAGEKREITFKGILSLKSKNKKNMFSLLGG